MMTGTSLKSGDTLDEYVLDEAVATGGMATVYRAHHAGTGLQVAIKVPHPEVESDPALFDRFERERDIGTRLNHPGVMKVIANPDRSQVYMVMEWLDGTLLRTVLNVQGRLPVGRAVRLTLGICEALEHIHAAGVVHRDLKPENIMVDDTDHVRLIDFGIAGKAGARRLTFANFSQNLGTPDYISPEQVRGRRGDARSDVFAVGVMLYEMLTGRVPFTGASPLAVMNDRLLNHPEPPRRLEPGISPELEEVLYRALEREPKHRYASARELAFDLEHPEKVGVATRPEAESWQKRKAPERRNWPLYAGLVALPLLLFLLLYVVSRH